MAAENIFRYERKFVISDEFFAMDSFLRTLKIPFQEVYHPRIINNVYFDTLQLQSYKENIHGKAERVKIRLRWYDEPHQKGFFYPKLEYKIKKALLGTKESYALAPLQERKQLLNKTDIYNYIKASDLPTHVLDDLLVRIPVLLNRYRRKYYQSLDGKVRLTIDSEIAFCRYSFLRNENYLQNHAPRILELKYDKENEGMGREVGQLLPFRLNKFSKYQVGIEKTFAYYAH